MNPVRIGAIVEGHGEDEAVPILIRRIALSIDPGFVPTVLPPVRAPYSRIRRDGELERLLNLLCAKLGSNGGIVILADCDWDDGCPAIEGPRLLRRAQQIRSDIPIGVVFAKKEFESWFLAAADSLRGIRGLPHDLTGPEFPEEIRGAKEWLTRRLQHGSSYAETTDQPALTQAFDIDMARRVDSFDKCYRVIRGMLISLRGAGA